MANFQPPPTWAELLLVDEKTGKSAFNPIWLNWFISLVHNIPPGGAVGSVTASSPLASSGGTSPNISISSSTGTGAVVLASSPTLTTPNIGSATGSVSGNAGTATALQNARTINSVSFDGTANITVAAAAGTLTGATLASGVTASSLTSAGASFFWGTGNANFGLFSARKTADESVTSSVTLQDDNHLILPIAANEEWEVKYIITCGDNLSASTGVKVAVTTPAGATQTITFALLNTVDAGANARCQRTTSSGGQLTWGTADISTASGSSLLLGTASVFNGGTAGNVQLRWAQQASSGIALTFFKGSFMEAVRTA